MQKAQNALIKKRIVVIFILSFFTLSVFSQKRMIKSNDDYILLNKTIMRHFIAKKKSDSIFIMNASPFLKDSVQAKKIRRYEKRRKKLDTLQIKIIADKGLYKQFLKKDAMWKKVYKKHLKRLNRFFSAKEVANYNKQLKNNCYLWDSNRVSFKNRVFIIKDIKYTKEEIKKLPKKQKLIEQRKIDKLEKKLNLFTFSKPIYSLNRQYALIAYNNGGTNVLRIFKKINNRWQHDFTLNNDHFIDRVLP